MSDIAIVVSIAAVLFVSGFCGITAGMFWIFDTDRRTCKAQIAKLSTDLANERHRAQARENEFRAEIASTKQKIALLADLLAVHHPNIPNTFNVNVGDVTAGGNIER